MNIAIVGGQGKMGQLLEKLLEKHGASIFPIGRKTEDFNETVAKCEVIVFSIPTTAFAETLEKFDKKGFKEKLIIDLSSQTTENYKILSSLSEHVSFIHFLFGPDISSIKNQNIIVSENIGDKRFDEIVSFLVKDGAHLTTSSPEHHDKIMAIVQALSQFNSIALAKTIAESGSDKKELDRFSSITFSLNAAVISRIVAQSPELWANIQFQNKYFLEVLERHAQNIEFLKSLVEKKDYSQFESMFTDVAGFWKEEKQSMLVEHHVNKKDQSKTLAVLGPEGSYSQQAALAYDKKAALSFFDSIPEIITALASGTIEEAILPFENSIQGTVLETLDGVYYNNLTITDETILDIHQCIAGIDNKISAENVRAIYSHPQSLGQCSAYLKKHYPQAKLILAPSNSAAFKKIRDEGLTDALAIGPKFGAELYGLKIISENIQDTDTNQTLFVHVSESSINASTLPYVILVIDPQKDRSGLLHDILDVFKKQNINLLKLESRPSRLKLGSYIFYIKAEIRRDDPKLTQSLDQLHQFGRITLITN